MKIEQTYTEEDFDRITKLELYNLWFRDALTDGQIAKLYGTTKSVVKEKRKKYNIKYINSAILYLAGRPEYRAKRNKKK